ncbi:MAG: HIRAN domain-containing protein, partial [Victivallales bacterium]
IHSHLAGLEYTFAQVQAGEKLILEREPENKHDSNAIKVMSGNERIGYLNRQDAFWLASLMDGGLIELKAAPLHHGSHTGTPVKLTIKTTSRGDSMLSPNRQDSPKAVLHNSLLTIYFNLDGYSCETLKKIISQYSTVMGDVLMLPETKLIFNIIMTRIKELENKPVPPMTDKLREFFKEIGIGQAISNENVTVVPLFGKIDDDCKYMSCGDALDKELLNVQEVSESGVVSTLSATNRGEKPVFIISGQGLKGAKQDRIVNVSIIIDIKTEIKVPVSCVEARRWHYSTNNVFRKSNVAAPQVRYSLHKSVNENVKTYRRYCSHQGEIWNTVDKVAEGAGVKSETSCLNDVYDNYEKKLKDFSEKIKYPDKACGLAVFNGSKLVSVDYFGHPELMKVSWDDIVRSVALGAVESANKSGSKKQGTLKADQEIKKFLDGILENAAAPERSPGKGQYVRSQSKKHKAGLLIDDDKLVHLSAYKI